MTKFRKKLIEVDAHQWFKNGDHPEDKCETITPMVEAPFQGEGKVVRYYRNPETPWDRECKSCNQLYRNHGWIDSGEQGRTVCPGDWIITGANGIYYPYHPDYFSLAFEPNEAIGREEFAEGRDHLTVTGAFQSDKFPWCPPGFVPLKLNDPAARDLLAEYARRRGPIDSAFHRDLIEGLENTPVKENAGYEPFKTIEIRND